MTSPKLLLALMATVASVQAAPQINEREVVGEVIQSLGPAIQQALASLGSSSSSSSSSNFGSSPVVGRVSSTSSASRPQTSRRISINNPRLGPPALGTGLPPGVKRSDWDTSVNSVSSVSSGPSVSSVTSSVVSQLQPSIAAAVAEALKASSRPVSRPQAVKAVEEPNYGPAKYNFGYKVADEESQAYINHQESREGNDVTGSYNYVNPAGALVTVNYEAGVDGFSQTRDVEQGAVQMRNIPGAWTGPLAGVDEVAPVSNNRASVSTSSSSSQLSQEALISQILSTIQPKITSAVQGALSSSSQTAGRRTVVQQVAAVPRPQAVRVAAPRPVASVSSSSSQLSQEALISQILSTIQPKISSAVQGALSSQTAGRRTVVQQVAAAPAVRVAAPRPVASRPRPGVIAPSSRRVQSSSSSRGSGLGDVFGNGETSVKFATPQFQFEF